MTASPAPLHPFHASRTEILKCERRGDTDGLLRMLELDEVRERPGLRKDVGLSLGKMPDERAAAAAENLARNDPDRGVRACAIYGLASRGTRVSVPFFIEQLRSDDPNTQLHAIHGLSNARLSEGVAPLIAMLDDRRCVVRCAAARGLAAIADPAALEPIKAAAKRAWWRPLTGMSLRHQLEKLEERI